MMNKLAIALIRFYQKFISPRKGFTCAHRALHGGDTCSVAVRKIIESNGLYSGFKSIQSRFRECQYASKEISLNQKAGLDCLECGDIGGCLDSGGFGGCFDAAGDSVSPKGKFSGCSVAELFLLIFSLSNPFSFLLLILFLSIGIGSGYFFYGSRVEQIGIRLIDLSLEDKDRKISFVKNSELPDYQLILSVNDEKILTNIKHNSSANDWLYLNVDESFDPKDLRKISVFNKQLLTRKELESVEYPLKNQENNKFEYKVGRRWSFD